MTVQDQMGSTKDALMRLAEVPQSNPLRRASIRRAFLTEAARLRAEPLAGRRLSRSVSRRGLRLATSVLVAVSVAFAGMTGLAYAADSARPGDLLYPLDREIEQLQLLLTVDPGQRADLLLEMADERLQEASDLAAQGDQENLETALDGYQQAVSSIYQTVQNEKDRTQNKLEERIDKKLSTQEEHLETIRKNVPIQAQDGIDRAIDTARGTPRPEPQSDELDETDSANGHNGQGTGNAQKTPGPPDDRPQGPPEGHGKPDKPKGDKK